MKPSEVRTTLDNWSPAGQQTPFSNSANELMNGPDIGLFSAVHHLQSQVNSLTEEVRQLRDELEGVRSTLPPSPLHGRPSEPPPPLSDAQARDLLAEMTAILENKPSPPRAATRPTPVRTSIPRLTLGEK